MHQKYAREGLVAISCSVDPIEKGTEEKVHKFLQKLKATFTNLLLNEPEDFWPEKLHCIAVPCIFVFNQEGKWTQFTDEFKHEDIERLVVELLKRK